MTSKQYKQFPRNTQNVLQSIATIWVNSNSRWNDAKIIKPALQQITAILPSLYVDG
jgi:hypothetical protein